MASLWTGLYPAAQRRHALRSRALPEAATPAEVFPTPASSTAGIWRNGWVEGYFGFDQGFEVYARPCEREARRPTCAARTRPLSFGGTDVDAVEAAPSSCASTAASAGSSTSTSWTCTSTPTTRERALRHPTIRRLRQRDPAIRTGCSSAAVPPALLQEGYLDKTLFVVASDHGEAFGERGREGHARNVYPEVTEVPLHHRVPVPARARRRRDAAHRQRRRLADALDLLGLPAPEGVDGRSRVPEILAAARGESRAPRTARPRSPISIRPGGSARHQPPRTWRSRWRLPLRAVPRGRTANRAKSCSTSQRDSARAQKPARGRARGRGAAARGRRPYLAGEPTWSSEAPSSSSTSSS